jgi:hypothetical protein
MYANIRESHYSRWIGKSAVKFLANMPSRLRSTCDIAVIERSRDDNNP